jgi:uncharacterized membrane protein
MIRYLAIDNLRGIAFIFMIIHHIFYFYDVSNGYTTSYSQNKFVDTSGTIARSLFILLAGISLSITRKKKDNIKKRFSRSLKIGLHALIISIVSYIYYPDYFIRFGVLHFIALSTFLLSFISPYKKLTLIILVLSILYKPSKINPIIDTITGASINYSMMDWFPLKPWISLMLTGLVIGQDIDLKLLDQIPYLAKNNLITRIGENSLELYTGHVLFLIFIYSLKNKKYI